MKLHQFQYTLKCIITFCLIFLLLYSLINLVIINKTNYVDQFTNETEGKSREIAHINGTVDSRKRIKRFIIFNGGGVVKLVLGTTFPIILPDKKRSLNQFYNLQLQYVPPPIPLYWWSLYNTSTFAARKQRSTDMLMHYDNSRAFIYKFIETILQRSGNFGNKCLLKVICEVARAPLSEDLHESKRRATQDNENDENGKENETEIVNVEDYGGNIYHKLINAIFTPLYSNVDERYINAREAGLNGANCDKTFGECFIVDDWFRRFVRFVK